jgi:hypothetical protein
MSLASLRSLPANVPISSIVPSVPTRKLWNALGSTQRLQGDKQLILHPKSHKGQLNIFFYVNADFANLWGYEEKQDPSCVKSCYGYIIFIVDCPVLWVSRLQSDIATSTMEAEYSAL